LFTNIEKNKHKKNLSILASCPRLRPLSPLGKKIKNKKIKNIKLPHPRFWSPKPRIVSPLHPRICSLALTLSAVFFFIKNLKKILVPAATAPGFAALPTAVG
jgi:hypothetical protein